MTKTIKISFLLCSLFFGCMHLPVNGMLKKLEKISSDKDDSLKIISGVTIAASSAVLLYQLENKFKPNYQDDLHGRQEKLIKKGDIINKTNPPRTVVNDAAIIELCSKRTLNGSYIVYYLEQDDAHHAEEYNLTKKYPCAHNGKFASLLTLIACQQNMNSKKKDPWFSAPDLLEEMEKDENNIKTVLSGKYKIHLMPIADHFKKCVELLMNKCATDEGLRKKIIAFKYICSLPESDEKILNNKEKYLQMLPRVVIYPQNGKDTVQALLHDIMALYKDANVQGLGIAPRFNHPQGYLDLVYWAQGDGDDKYAHPTFFDQTNNQCCYDVQQISPVPPHTNHYVSFE